MVRQQNMSSHQGRSLSKGTDSRHQAGALESCVCTWELWFLPAHPCRH